MFRDNPKEMFSMNTIVWEDDAQIVEIHARKEYGTPGIILEVEEMI